MGAMGLFAGIVIQIISVVLVYLAKPRNKLVSFLMLLAAGLLTAVAVFLVLSALFVMSVPPQS